MIAAPECSACGEPCRFVYVTASIWPARRPWANVADSGRFHDPAILWLCASCVDAAARGR